MLAAGCCAGGVTPLWGVTSMCCCKLVFTGCAEGSVAEEYAGWASVLDAYDGKEFWVVL